MTRPPEPPDGAWDLLVVGGGTAGIVAAIAAGRSPDTDITAFDPLRFSRR